MLWIKLQCFHYSTLISWLFNMYNQRKSLILRFLRPRQPPPRVTYFPLCAEHRSYPCSRGVALARFYLFLCPRIILARRLCLSVMSRYNAIMRTNISVVPETLKPETRRGKINCPLFTRVWSPRGRGGEEGERVSAARNFTFPFWKISSPFSLHHVWTLFAIATREYWQSTKQSDDDDDDSW